MIVIATDFGCEGPYLGQMKAVLLREAPSIPCVELFCNLPPFDIEAAAYLLAAYAGEFPEATVFLCVVDPGVGGTRRAAIVQADGRWYVGPDNGMLNIIAHRAQRLCWWDITWRPEHLSHSFHGRDLFAPVAARIARGDSVPGDAVDPQERLLSGWPEDLARIVYVDRYGNLLTGLRAEHLAQNAVIESAGRRFEYARTFSAVAPGSAFWYANANGLVEIAVNQGNASAVLGLKAGDGVQIIAQGDQAT